MKKTLIAIWVLLATPVQAATPTALLCLFEPLAMRFNLFTKDGQDVIQWESSGFQGVVINVSDGYFVVKHYASTATFKAVISVTTLQGYGVVETFKGETSKGGIICAAD